MAAGAGFGVFDGGGNEAHDRVLGAFATSAMDGKGGSAGCYLRRLLLKALFMKSSTERTNRTSGTSHHDEVAATGSGAFTNTRAFCDRGRGGASTVRVCAARPLVRRRAVRMSSQCPRLAMHSRHLPTGRSLA